MVINSVSALDFSFNSPKEAEINDEIDIELILDSSETYDVKIFIHNSEDNKITRSEYISEIMTDDWSDSWYYVKEAYPKNKNFDIRVTESPGDREICVRLRESQSSKVETLCEDIIISEIEDTTEESETIEEPIKEEKEEPKEERNEKIESDEKSVVKTPISNKIEKNNKPEIEKIKLSKNKNQEIKIETKESSKSNFILYSFFVLFLIIIVLLALRRL